MRIRRIVVATLMVTAVVVPSGSGVAMAASKSPMTDPVSPVAMSKSPMTDPVSPAAMSKSPMAVTPVPLSALSKKGNSGNKTKKSSKTPR